jgi:hypothetical protein
MIEILEKIYIIFLLCFSLKNDSDILHFYSTTKDDKPNSRRSLLDGASGRVALFLLSSAHQKRPLLEKKKTSVEFFCYARAILLGVCVFLYI